MKKTNRFWLPFIFMVAFPTIFGINLQAQDWHQWRGENRDGISKERGLNFNWAVKKPPLVWTFNQAGAGYSAPVVVGKTLYCQGSADDIDFAFALDIETGNLKWKQKLGEQFIQDRGDGPRGSVTVDGDRLYLIRGSGQLHCLSAIDGKMIWQKDFKEDFDGKIMSQWGYSESPLVDENLVICTPGGEKGTMIALDKKTGATVWISKEWTDECGYSSAIVAEIEGVKQYIQHSAKGVAGISAKDGKLLWKVEIEGYRVATIPTPICIDNTVYITNGYNAGCNYLNISKKENEFKAETIYSNKNMVNHHGGVVLYDGHIYGYSETIGWACQNLKSGEIVWSNRVKEVGKGAALIVDDKLLCLDETTGQLTVIAASPTGWKEIGNLEFPQRTEILSKDNKVWTHPVVANGKLYLRDHDLIFCIDLK